MTSRNRIYRTAGVIGGGMVVGWVLLWVAVLVLAGLA